MLLHYRFNEYRILLALYLIGKLLQRSEVYMRTIFAVFFYTYFLILFIRKENRRFTGTDIISKPFHTLDRMENIILIIDL